MKSAGFTFKTAIIDSGVVFRFVLGAGVAGFSLLLFKLQAIRHLADRWIVALDSRTSKEGRKSIYPVYKENRRGRLSQAQIDRIQDAMQKFKWFCQLQHITLYEAAGWEADDVIATWTARPENRPVLIVSPDKDLFQLLDTDVSLLRDLNDLEIYKEEDLYKDFGVTPREWSTVLAFTGDSADNIPGVRGIGIKKGVTLVKRLGAEVAYEDPNFVLSKRLVTLRTDLELREVKEEPPEEFARWLYRLCAIQEAVCFPKSTW